ncbi:MAG TPA: wax ester/triacylglycerol synthase family O-acyltransferase [Dermatophilaceae bacterium]|nr:wax ester/triacylglycerol synthase family O-acyltransferase [Dermatophilaceae bacterium]
MQPVQMEAADAAYLSFDGPGTDANVCLYMPLEGPVTLEEVREQVAGGLRRMPELRRKLHMVLGGMDLPWWIDDPAFAVANQVTESIVPQPAGQDQIDALVGELGGRKLDREHPLWAVHVLQVPARGRRAASSALLLKVHHAIADGVRYQHIVDALFGPRTTPAPVEDPTWHPTLPPSDAELLARSAAATSAWMATQLTDTVRQLSESVHTWPTLTIPSVRAAPQTAFNRSVTAGRSWAGTSLEIAASKQVRQREEVTVGAVFNAAIAGGLRSWLLAREALPRMPLVALLPIGEAHDRTGAAANQIGISSCGLPTDVADPLERLRAAHDMLSQAKSAPLMRGSTMSSATRFAAPALGAMASSLTATTRLYDYVSSSYNLLVSSVAQPPDVLTVAGREVLAEFPMGPVFDGMGVNVTAHGYRGQLDVGVATCADLVPDAREIADGIAAAYRELCRL